jgi:hypothetical protein
LSGKLPWAKLNSAVDQEDGIKVVKAIAFAAVALASACSHNAGGNDEYSGPHGVRISDYPLVTCELGDEDVARVSQVNLEDCAVLTQWGPRPDLVGQESTCGESELIEYRKLFTDEMMELYRNQSLPQGVREESGAWPVRVIINSGRGEEPFTMRFLRDDSQSEEVQTLVDFCEALFVEFGPDS